MGSVPLAVIGALIALVLVARSPAYGSLDRTLSAMARVRSAHCVGWLMSYMDRKPNGALILGRMRVDWWYRAPDDYRRYEGPQVPGWNLLPETLIVRGERAVRIIHGGADPGRRIEMSRARLTRELSPIDFFSQECILRRAQREKHARILAREGDENGHAIRTFTIVYTQGISRLRWVLSVDPSSDLIRRAEWTWERDNGRAWEPAARQTLERFEYNIPVPDDLFEVPHPLG